VAAYRHSIDIRYGECDRQGVVFNANYLAYGDDAMDHRMRSLNGAVWVESWDVMLKAARVVWHGPATWPERLDVDCGVCRWGRTSFDVAYVITVEGRPVADVVVTYVSVEAGTAEPVEPPAEVVAAMGETVPVPESLASR
jgi:acyl-CoA thioester hydrolase